MPPLAWIDLLKAGLALGGAALVLAWARLPHRVRLGALAGLVAVAAVNYARWSPSTLTGAVDAYDLVHYDLGAKYAPELGWTDLYPAILLADETAGPRFPGAAEGWLARTPDGFRRASIAEGLARGRAVRDERFTPERWSAFVHDFTVLQRETRPGLIPPTWRDLLLDHGFNGTPGWTLLARPLAEAVPVEHVKLLGWLDGALLLGALALVGSTYGATPLLWVALWCGVSFALRWPTVTFAFLRYDWVAGLLVATCLLRRGRPVLAGAVAGLAAALRVVPVFWALGLVRRRLAPALAAGALSAALLTGAGVAVSGVEASAGWASAVIVQQRPDELAPRAVGLPVALTWDGRATPLTFDAARREAMARATLPCLLLAGVGVVAIGARLRRLPEDEAFAYGFVPFFLCASAEYYYGAGRVTLALIHAANLDRPRHRALLAGLLGLEAVSNAARVLAPPSLNLQTGLLSWGLVLYTIAIAVHLWWPEEALRSGSPGV